MSSRAPTQAAFNRTIRGRAEGNVPSGGRPVREPRPTERAQYMSEERRDRELLLQQKPKPKRQNRENRTPLDIGKAAFASRDIDLNTSKGTPALHLTPQSGRVPPLGVRPTQKIPTERGNTGRNDIMTQGSDFINSPRGYYGMRPQAKQLTHERAAELTQRRQNTAKDLFPTEERDTPEPADRLSDDQDRGRDEQSQVPREDAAVDAGSGAFQYRDTDEDDSESGGHTSAGKRRRETEVDKELDNDESIEREIDQTRKRTRVTENSNLNDEQDEDGWRNPTRIRPSNGRVAAKDYEGAVQEILKTAIGLFRSHLTAVNAYLDRIAQVTWAKQAWMEACSLCNLKINFNSDIIQLITNRTWHLTSELKTKIRPLVELIYDFESSARITVQARNRKLVEDLTEDFGLCYKFLGDPDNDIPRRGLYENKIIQKAINVSFYMDKRDEGVLYPQYFEPFPIAGMALILTVIEACIDEWSSGERCDIPFGEAVYRPVYELHLSQLREFEERTKDYAILQKLLTRFNEHGRRHAKVVTPLNETLKRALDDESFLAAIREFEARNGNFSDSDEEQSLLSSRDQSRHTE